MIPFRSVVSTILISVLGITALWHATSGGSAWTAESARRLNVIHSPIKFPDVDLQSTRFDNLSLADYQQQVIVVDFIYTQCPSICQAMGAEFRSLQSEFKSRGLAEDVQLLSLTFDSRNDGIKQLTEYLNRFSASETQWAAARFREESELQGVLDDLGVVVIPDPDFGYIHNAAVYLVVKGHVIGIYDFDDREKLMANIALLLRNV